MRGTCVAEPRAVSRTALLCLLLAGCWTNARGRVDVKATTGIWGGALIVGGAAVGAGRCAPSTDQCDRVERGDPMLAGALVITGAALLGLAVLIDRAEAD